ncbi:MAG: OsmC family protein [Pseudomonadota bacterium]
MNVQDRNITADNGVDVEALLGIRQTLTDMPAAAQFKWRATCEWLKGVHSRSTIETFYGAGDEQAHKRSYTVEADHPLVFAAPDEAPTPVEIVLSGLASCLTGGVAAVAQNRGIKLNSVIARVEGDMNLQGILGIDSDVRNGFSAIRVRFEIDADASKDEIAAVVAQSQKRSAVFDVITNPTHVDVAVV